MTVAVIDATSGDTRLDLVLLGWTKCGLTRPVAFAQRGDDADPYKWSILAAERSDLTERNETINDIGKRRDLRIVVPLEPPKEGDSLDVSDLVSEVNSLVEDFTHTDVDGSRSRPPCTLLLIARRHEQEWLLNGVAPILQAFGWSEILVVSPEDSPSPQEATELEKRTIAPVAAHCLASAMGLWTFVPATTDDDHTGGGPRLVRSWTRVVDAGFLIDHVGRALATVELSHTRSVEERIDEVIERLWDSAVIAEDLIETEPELQSTTYPGRWEYLLAFLRLLLTRFVPLFVRNLVSSLLRPIIDAIYAAVSWISDKLGFRPPTNRGGDDTGERQSELAAELERCQWSLIVLDANDELEDPPPAKPALWRSITEVVLEAADAGLLTVGQLTTIGGDPAVLDRLDAQYESLRMSARTRLEREMKGAGAVPGATPATSDSEPPSLTRRVGRRLRRKLFGLAAIALGIVLFLAVPAIGLLYAVVVASCLIVGRRILQAIALTIRQIIGELKRRFAIDEDAETLERLRVARSDTERFTYRVDQGKAWAELLAAVLNRAGQGPPITETGQGTFEPGCAPRALSFASAEVSAETAEQTAREILSDKKLNLFATIWNSVRNLHPDLYQQRSRHITDGGATEVRAIRARGLPVDASNAGREFLWKQVSKSPHDHLDGVREWVRSKDPFGLESVTPGPGHAPGPVNRGSEPTDQSPADIERLLNAACHLLQGADGAAIAIASVFAPDRAVVPSSIVAKLPNGEQDSWIVGTGELALNTSGLDDAMPSPAPVGLLANVRVGRAVVVGSLVEGEVTPIWATIESESGGMFALDQQGAVGSPVIDVATRSIIGVVADSGGRFALGPITIGDALRSAAPQAVAPGELDPGMVIPLDVLLTSEPPSGDGGGADTQGDELSGCLDLDAWLNEIAAPQQAFAPVLFRNSDYDEVAHAQPPPAAAITRLPSGRMLIARSCFQESVLIPQTVLSLDAAAAGAQPSAADGNPNSRDEGTDDG